MKAAMNSHVAQERHTMFQSSADNVKSRLSVTLKELEAHMNDKADEVYIAMRRDYNSVLGGGEVPRNGEILPKTQRLVRKEMMRIIDSVEKVFSKIAGFEVKDEDDEEDKKFSHGSDDEDGAPAVGKKEQDEDLKLKRETSPSAQLRDQEQRHRETCPDEPMAGEDSDRESEAKLKNVEDQEQSEDDVNAKVDSGDSDGSGTSSGTESAESD